MNSVIYNPLEEYEKSLKALHLDNTNSFFDNLVKQSGINIDQNHETVKNYINCNDNLRKIRKKLTFFKIIRVLMIITILLIPAVILKITPKIRDLKNQIEKNEQESEIFLKEAEAQMLPLNRLFTCRDALKIIETTIPQLSFEPCFSAKQETDMITNFDFCEPDKDQQTTQEVLAGKYNENPFVFENKLIHTMGTETYHGYKTIHWSETYIDADGKRRRRTRTQTLHASVIKPKPFYTNQVVLNYGSQGGPDLSFSRDASLLHLKNDKQIEKYVKKGEKKLKKMTDEAISQNDDFMSMSNSDFEVLFDALDRTDEVQYRTLFTPLAQTNMVDLILSDTGYGDDFSFIKTKRMNKIVSNHSQGRKINLEPDDYISYSFDIIKENFINKNTEFFKAVYFDFAPILAIPIYQERPVNSLNPIPAMTQKYSQKECEALANAADSEYMVHSGTKTKAILKSRFVKSKDNAEEICVTAYTYDIVPQIDIVSVLGGDGRYHNVSVSWDEYVPLESSSNFFVADSGSAKDKDIIATRNGLCLFK